MMKGSSALLSQLFKQRGSALSLDTSSSRFSSSYRVLSTSALPNSDHHESEKMVSEGGGSTASFHEKKDELKDKAIAGKDGVADAAGEKADQAKSVADKVSEQAKKEMNTSADMVKDVPQKVSETTQELKEVGVEAAKAVKRDATKVAEKVGLKSPS